MIKISSQTRCDPETILVALCFTRYSFHSKEGDVTQRLDRRTAPGEPGSVPGLTGRAQLHLGGAERLSCHCCAPQMDSKCPNFPCSAAASADKPCLSEPMAGLAWGDRCLHSSWCAGSVPGRESFTCTTISLAGASPAVGRSRDGGTKRCSSAEPHGETDHRFLLHICKMPNTK